MVCQGEVVWQAVDDWDREKGEREGKNSRWNQRGKEDTKLSSKLIDPFFLCVVVSCVRLERSPPNETPSRRNETLTFVNSTSSPRLATLRRRRRSSRTGRRLRRGLIVSFLLATKPKELPPPRKNVEADHSLLWVRLRRTQRPEQDSDFVAREGEEGTTSTGCVGTSGSGCS